MMSKEENRDGWSRWVAFTDAAEVAPDTLRDAVWLAARYTRITGQPISATEVRALMPKPPRSAKR
jgi:hypothetical protein